MATPRAGLYRGMPGGKSDVGRRLDAHRAHRPRRAEGGQMELALLWRRGPRLVPVVPRLNPLCRSDLLPRRVVNVLLDIHEDDQLDEAQLAAWVKQASCPANACKREVARCVRGVSGR
jgi:hypothetical protein